MPSLWPAKSLLGGVAQTYEFGLKFSFSCLKIPDFLNFFFSWKTSWERLKDICAMDVLIQMVKKALVKVALEGRDGNAPF